MKKMKKGFTLVEMLVVIGIIGVLTGVLLASFGGSGESARAARCLSNMKNLASACQTYAMANHYYPLAGNRIYLSVDESRGIKNVQKLYSEVPGWLSTMTKGKYPGSSYSQGAAVSLYSTDDDAVLYALTNGALWKYVSGNRNTYLCPTHVTKCGSRMRPNWSYRMNSYFGWDKNGRASASTSYGRIEYGQLQRADKRLLLAEFPFAGYHTKEPEGESGTDDTDAILQYEGTSSASGGGGASATSGDCEEVGVNHIKGKHAFAHVAFADGHVEKLAIPVKNGKPDLGQIKDLSAWLCGGLDVSYDGKQYQKQTN